MITNALRPKGIRLGNGSELDCTIGGSVGRSRLDSVDVGSGRIV